jgi:hypothetical protein
MCQLAEIVKISGIGELCYLNKLPVATNNNNVMSTHYGTFCKDKGNFRALNFRNANDTIIYLGVHFGRNVVTRQQRDLYVVQKEMNFPWASQFVRPS